MNSKASLKEFDQDNMSTAERHVMELMLRDEHPFWSNSGNWREFIFEGSYTVKNSKGKEFQGAVQVCPTRCERRKDGRFEIDSRNTTYILVPVSNQESVVGIERILPPLLDLKLIETLTDQEVSGIDPWTKTPIIGRLIKETEEFLKVYCYPSCARSGQVCYLK